MSKVLQELFWTYFFGCPYCSSSAKIHLDAALFVPKKNCSRQMSQFGSENGTSS